MSPNPDWSQDERNRIYLDLQQKLAELERAIETHFEGGYQIPRDVEEKIREAVERRECLICHDIVDEKREYRSGLCRKDYNRCYYQIRKGRLTWTALYERGMAAPEHIRPSRATEQPPELDAILRELAEIGREAHTEKRKRKKL